METTMTITTANNAKFDTTKPAKSNIFMVFDSSGQKVMDSLRITGKTTTVTEFMRPVTMIEVEHSFGIDEVNEEFIWQ
jgi:hypothetical protein